MFELAKTLSKALPLSLNTIEKQVGANDLIIEPLEHDRGNRLCVTLSDIHLTDGSVGIQNLPDDAWKEFFTELLEDCQKYDAHELILILDGDVVDLIRSGAWYENGVYPWERKRPEFAQTVDQIIRNIVQTHAYFFSLLRNMETRFKQHCPNLNHCETLILLGNHDKELLAVDQSLAFFYEHALGKTPADFSERERKIIGRMYGDEAKFLDKNTVPYFRFYYGDAGFRFFTTHGQWRDSENSFAVKANTGTPGWSAGDGWRPDIWEKLGYSPFLEPCFGDTVAAGVLSSFIMSCKKQLQEAACATPRLTRMLDELDLYRPSYLAPQRILQETRLLRQQAKHEPAEIIETTLIYCINQWLSWDFTYQSASKKLWFILHIARPVMAVMKLFGRNLHLKVITGVLKVLNFFSHHAKEGVPFSDLVTFPPFLPQNRHLNLQIHGEGHTHKPLQEELRLKDSVTNFTYINFGTWRDRIVARKKNGYRRRGVLRYFTILDLVSSQDPNARRFGYFTKDVIKWSDELDKMDNKVTAAKHVASSV
ncbi:MAG: hypothetical protein OEZ68_03210 [Gammaproteobacteria bacterium]|nr:hypothetical protein [Gammaproteobacteria bacterium]MDH5799792.1 hypothetical protein [Gammaproteobacteria bacterium]